MALYGASYLFDGRRVGMFIFPSIIALIVGFIGLRFGSDSWVLRSGQAEELFGEDQRVGQRDERNRNDQVADLC